MALAPAPLPMVSEMRERRNDVKGLVIDVLAGGLIGGLVGAVVAVNFVLVVGVEEGYEASLGEVFQHSIIAGAVTLAVLAAGPVLGVLAARRRRRLARNSPGDQVEARNG